MRPIELICSDQISHALMSARQVNNTTYTHSTHERTNTRVQMLNIKLRPQEQQHHHHDDNDVDDKVSEIAWLIGATKSK